MTLDVPIGAGWRPNSKKLEVGDNQVNKSQERQVGILQPPSGAPVLVNPPDPLTLTLRTLPRIPDSDEAPWRWSAVPTWLEIVPGRDSPGTTPWSFLRAIKAPMALNHLISSSSLGAQRRRVRFVVTILNVWESRVESWSEDADVGGLGNGVWAVKGIWRFGGRSYSSASRICENWNSRCGFVSCIIPCLQHLYEIGFKSNWPYDYLNRLIFHRWVRTTSSASCSSWNRTSSDILKIQPWLGPS